MKKAANQKKNGKGATPDPANAALVKWPASWDERQPPPIAPVVPSSGRVHCNRSPLNQSLLFGGYDVKRILQGRAVGVTPALERTSRRPRHVLSWQHATYLLRNVDASHKETFPLVHVWRICCHVIASADPRKC